MKPNKPEVVETLVATEPDARARQGNHQAVEEDHADSDEK